MKKEAKKPKKIARIIIILILLGLAGYVGYSVYSYMKSPGGTYVIRGEEVDYGDHEDRYYRIYGKCESRPAFDGWRVLPIRTEEEYNVGLIGGEGMQLMHGITRSPSNPDIIYLSHDGGQVWKSKDGGDTWKHVKQMDPGVQRRYQHSLTYDPASISATEKRAMTWYVAAPGDGLFRSDDGGDTWSESLGLTQQSQKITTIYDIECHPTNGKTVYAGTSRGLYQSWISRCNLFGGAWPKNNNKS